MIYDEICTYEVCKLAKDKGFPQHITEEAYIVDNYGEDDYNIGDIVPIPLMPDYMDDAAAPTQSLLQRWLREEKGIIIDVVFDWQYNIEAEEIRYQYRIGSKRRMTIGGVQTRGIVCGRYYDTYELALEDALKYALENLV